MGGEGWEGGRRRWEGAAPSGRSAHPATPMPPEAPAAPVLPVSYRLSHTRLAFFLREVQPPPPPTANSSGGGALQRSEPFVVFQTKELPILNVSLGPFSTSQVLARELLQPASTLDIPERLTVNWKVRAFIVHPRVPASQPVAQVLFYVAGRDWDDFGATERLPCVRLHAFRNAHEYPLLRIGSISLFRPPPKRALQEHRLDSNLIIRLPDRPLKPGEVLSILLYLAPNSSSSSSSPSVEHFTLRVKAKKGVTLLGTKARSGQWQVTSELLTGGKHSTATVDVSRIQSAPLLPREGEGPLEILQLDFEMENFTSQSVKRRIMWHIDYRGRSPLPDLERAVTELTVIQRDVQAILPLAMDTEIINTAILTGRTVAIPVKVIAIEVTGVVLDVSALVECESNNEDIIKVSSSCDYVFVSGKESRGSMNARVTFRYDILSAPLEMTVWVPKLPLHIELSDARLSQVKGWRVPILPDRRSARESEDEEEEEEERRQNRGCTLQYQHSTLQVFTQFHTTSSEGTDQVVTMLGPDWLVEVTDLVSDFMRVGDPRVAQLVDSSTLAGLEPGTTPFKVVSPLTEAILGETMVTVTEEKVSITELRGQVVASLSLSLRPSPGNSHTILATTAAQQTLSFLKQEALLSLWLSYSDGTTAPLSLYSPRDYSLLVSSRDERVATVTQDRAFPLVVAEAEGEGLLLQADLTIAESCQKSKRKSILATAAVGLRVHFGNEEEDPTYDYPGPSQPGPGGDGGDGEDQVMGAGYPGTASPQGPPTPGTASPQTPTEDFPPIPTGFTQMPRGLTDLEIGMYALLGVFCLAILVFLINCIVFVLRYRHKRIPPEGQTSMDHSHHWVFLGNGQPLRAQGELSPPAGNPLEAVPACCHGDHHSSGSSQTSVQSQVHGRGDGSSGGSARDQAEDPASSPTSKRKRVKFTTFTTMPSEELAYDSVPAGEEEEEEDLRWGCPDVAGGTLAAPQDLHNYIRRIKEIA
uniref:Transmembrane protein 132E n=1 Tax=Sarcophilus harrisii TaxID=9305 RepID=G3WCL6_SARHA